ncbi:hypothetical protein WMY93_029775 [Mugilogobius chulae]|uniref:Uncharacterized protein n=1 Tax=Mugilogobius chulae TaxID=88201 RepID=A0AAW0MS73_9GOBI
MWSAEQDYKALFLELIKVVTSRFSSRHRVQVKHQPSAAAQTYRVMKSDSSDSEKEIEQKDPEEERQQILQNIEEVHEAYKAQKLPICPQPSRLICTIAFLDYFNNNIPPNCSLTNAERKQTWWEVKLMLKDSGRTVSAHQQKTKSNKEQKPVPKKLLAKCQEEAPKVIPSILDDIEKASVSDKKIHCRFFGYLSAYFASIYGHRTSVFTMMIRKEVLEAHGDDDAGYLNNVMQHKTVQTYGVSQLYVHPEEYEWFLRWSEFGGERPLKDLRTYMGQAWSEMGLGDLPTFMDIRTSLATYNFQQNLDPGVREKLANFMCHSDKIQEKFPLLE